MGRAVVIASSSVPRNCILQADRTPLPLLTKRQTRITTKYSFKPPPSIRKARRRKRANGNIEERNTETTDIASDAQGSAQNKATLTLKTYDPVSGVCLKYKTEKAAEIGRLIGSLGRLGRHMAALPPSAEADVAMTEAVEHGRGDVGEDVGEDKDAAVTGSTAPSTGGATGGGAGKKKRKGKR